MKRIFPVVFFLTALLIIFLRFYKLGEIPQGLNIDEASYGYDAYSILKTGKDQWGNKLPLTLKSFNDYKPAGLSYAIIPAIKLFDLNTKSVRFPSAFFGLLTLPILYLTLNELRKNKYLNLLLVTIYALSPWTYGISRTFYEPNIALFFISLSLLLLLRSFGDKKPKYTYQAFALLAISGYFYAALRYLSLIIIAVFIFIWNRKKKNFNFFTKQTLLFGLIILPLLQIMFSPVGLRRLNQEKQLLTFGHELVIDENRQMCFLSFNKDQTKTNLCYALWNKPVQNIIKIFDTWAVHLSPEYLFFTGSHPDIISEDQGAYLSWLLPFYVIGLIILSEKTFKEDKPSAFLLLILLSAPLPAALVQTTRIHRNVVGLYLVFLCISVGIHAVSKYFKKSKLPSILFFSILTFTALFMSTRYLVYYHTSFIHAQTEVWNYDSEEIYKFVIDNEDDYDTVIDNVFRDGPLYYAFYEQTDPAYFQSKVSRNNPNENGWIHNNRLGSIRNGGPNVHELLCIKNINQQEDISTLIITSPIEEFSEYAQMHTESFNQVHVLHEIYDIDDLYSNLTQENYNFTVICNL